MLKIFEPMILPSERSGFFLRTAVIEAANSGRDVPHAIRVMEMNPSSTPKSLAMSIALLTN